MIGRKSKRNKGNKFRSVGKTSKSMKKTKHTLSQKKKKDGLLKAQSNAHKMKLRSLSYNARTHASAKELTHRRDLMFEVASTATKIGKRKNGKFFPERKTK